MLTGADTVEEALQIIREVELILRQGGFELRKRVSTKASLLHKIENQEIPYSVLDLHNNNFKGSSNQEKHTIKYRPIVRSAALNCTSRNYIEKFHAQLMEGRDWLGRINSAAPSYSLD